MAGLAVVAEVMGGERAAQEGRAGGLCWRRLGMGEREQAGIYCVWLHAGRGSQGRGVRAIGPFPPVLGSLLLDRPRPTTSQILILFFVSRPLPLPLALPLPAPTRRPPPPPPACARLPSPPPPLPPRGPGSQPRLRPGPCSSASVAVAVAHRHCRRPPFGAEFSTAPGSLLLAPSTSTHTLPPAPAPRFFRQGTTAPLPTQQHLNTTTTRPRHPFASAVPLVRLIFSLAADFWPAFCPPSAGPPPTARHHGMPPTFPFPFPPGQNFWRVFSCSPLPGPLQAQAGAVPAAAPC